MVMVATKSPKRATKPLLKRKLDQWTSTSKVAFPNFTKRLRQFTAVAPAGAKKSDVLTDDFAPVDGLLRTR